MTPKFPLTKVHVDLPNHWAVGGESMWARPLGGSAYEIHNVPFYAYDLSFLDVVEAIPANPTQKPSILRVIRRSGHRTLRSSSMTRFRRIGGFRCSKHFSRSVLPSKVRRRGCSQSM